MNRLALLLAGVILLSLVSTAPLLPAQAAEATPAQDSAPRSQPGEETPTETSTSLPDGPLSGSEQRRAEDKGGIFRPSEDISEDLAVAFPVDI